MIEMLSSLFGVLVSGLSFIISTIQSFLRLIQIAFEFVTFGSAVMAFMPSPIVLFITLGISVSLIYVIVGR